MNVITSDIEGVVIIEPNVFDATFTEIKKVKISSSPFLWTCTCSIYFSTTPMG